MNIENHEPDIYRDQLVDKLKKSPEEGRQEILEKAKEDPEYWKARNKKIEGRQNEEEIDDGLGVFVKKKTLYHGTSAFGIEDFDLDKNDGETVGRGIYLTSKAEHGIGYAKVRANRSRDYVPVVYEAVIENLKLCDLRKDKNVEKVLNGFLDILQKEIKREDNKWYYRNALNEAMRAIARGKTDDGVELKAGNIGLIIAPICEIFSKYVGSLGYDGLVTFEGGEGFGENKIGNHDTYLIFDPEKVKIVKEQKIKKTEHKKVA